MKPEIIVFDCDGVILESVEAKTRAFGRTVEEYGPDAVKRFVDYHLAHGGVSRFEKFKWFFREILDQPLTPEGMDSLSARFTEMCFEEVRNAPFVPGALECIRACEGKIPMHVASGTPQEELSTIFEQRKLAPYFGMILGTPPAKAALLARIVAETGADPARTLMVGDSSTDKDAADQVGTLFYGRGASFKDQNVPWGEDLSRLVHFIESM